MRTLPKTLEILPLNIKAAWLLVGVVLSFFGHAQNAEIGLSGGGSNFVGDVGHYGIHAPTGYYYGGFFRYTFQQYYALRVGGHAGVLENRDEWSQIEERKRRNLSFRSDIWDAYAVVEFNFFEFNPRSKEHNKTFFIFGGIGIMGYNPKAFYEDEWVDLRPLGTEGQGTPLSQEAVYSKVDLMMPFGMGFKWAFNEHWQISLDFTAHSTATDYLDDASGKYVNAQDLSLYNGELAGILSDRSGTDLDKSQYYRGNPDNNDWYFYSGLSLIWRFTSNYEKCDKFWGR